MSGHEKEGQGGESMSTNMLNKYYMNMFVPRGSRTNLLEREGDILYHLLLQDSVHEKALNQLPFGNLLSIEGTKSNINNLNLYEMHIHIFVQCMERKLD